MKINYIRKEAIQLIKEIRERNDYPDDWYPQRMHYMYYGGEEPDPHETASYPGGHEGFHDNEYREHGADPISYHHHASEYHHHMATHYEKGSEEYEAHKRAGRLHDRAFNAAHEWWESMRGRDPGKLSPSSKLKDREEAYKMRHRIHARSYDEAKHRYIRTMDAADKASHQAGGHPHILDIHGLFRHR